MLHGITNTPQQYAQLAPQLFSDGHSVVVPRFPYHGYRDRMTAALERLTIEDLLATSLEAIAIGAMLAHRVDLLGISAGANLAAWLGLRVALEHVVAVSPFFGVIYLPGPVNDALAWAFERLPNTFAWWDPIRQVNQLPLHAYPRFPTRALAATLGLASGFDGTAVERYHARRLTLVLNAHDPIVNNELACRRAAAVARPDLDDETVVLSNLPYLHDIIEPTLPHGRTDLVYPVIREIVAGTYHASS
jgi:hypothetical protein